MVHHRQGLALGFKARHNLARDHPELDELESDATLDRLFLLRHVNHAKTAFTHFLQKLVTAERLTHSLVGAISETQFDARSRPNWNGSRRRVTLFLRHKSGRDAPEQRKVSRTRSVQKCRTFGRWTL